MTNRSLKRRLWRAALFVVFILSISLIEYIYRYPHNTTTYVSSNATLFALLVAAYLAYVFQQRGKFVEELRSWWNSIVEAKSEFFIYCDKKSPTEEDYLRSFYKLSICMDTLRLIYCNIGRSNENSKGYYPFEQVRDIIDLARWANPTRQPTIDQRRKTKLAIDLIFQSLRHAIQAEASASTPDDPTLFESPYREKYLDEIYSGLGIDVMKIRSENKGKDYVSQREKR